MDEQQRGYDPDRFISTVQRSLLCSICACVPKEPRLCVDGEHSFCLSCISRYLIATQECPDCKKPLTPDTLVLPQRILRESLGELQIKCDNIERGCPDHIQLRNLENHLGLCGFAPATCEKCGMQLNRKDKDNHEKSFCQLGGAKCQECENVKANQDEMKQELCQLTGRLAEMEMNANVVPAQLNEIMNEQDENVNELKRKHDQMEDEMQKVKRKLRKIQKKGKQNTNTSMAARGEDVSSYDVDRFVGEVKEDLLCSICKCVPKDPGLCENNDHIFCFTEISRHLENSQTCPYCRDPLTLETLKRPNRFLKNYIAGLKIKCDHHDRGCPDELSLEGLKSHVDQCGYAPVMCGNEGCEMVVNKRDKDNHEKSVCQFRIPKWHEMKASQDEVKDDLNTKINSKTTAIERKQDQIQDELNTKINSKRTAIKRKQDQIQDDLNKKIDSKTTAIKRKQDQIQVEMKVELNKMKDKMTGMERKQDRMQESVDEMKQKFDKMIIMVHQALQGSNVNNNGAQATDPRISSNNHDIVILGGWNASGVDKVSNTVEKFDIVEGKSTELPQMNKPRGESASCVYNGDVIVTGGYDGQDGTDSIEILKMNQHPLRWTMFGGKLPVKLYSHAAIVYQNKLYVVGGYNWDENKTSDVIYEVDLAPPYAAKILTRMPQARRYHKAEIVNGKLFILAGSTTVDSEDALGCVVVYDFITNEFKTCPPLPKPVYIMSTVTWGNMVIVVGGMDKNDQDLNDVIMYDTETGRSERLPSMKHKRRGHSAVIVDDVILAFGGWNQEQKYLNSVESFTMGSDGWKELPAMKEKRSFASAVVVPRI